MQIDPMDPVPAGNQRAAQTVEKIGDRPLQKQERARFGRRLWLVALDLDVMSPHRSVRSGRVEGGDGSARTPALTPDPETFEEIDRFPVHIRLAQAEPGDR